MTKLLIPNLILAGAMQKHTNMKKKSNQYLGPPVWDGKREHEKRKEIAKNEQKKALSLWITLFLIKTAIFLIVFWIVAGIYAKSDNTTLAVEMQDVYIYQLSKSMAEYNFFPVMKWFISWILIPGFVLYKIIEQPMNYIINLVGHLIIHVEKTNTSDNKCNQYNPNHNYVSPNSFYGTDPFKEATPEEALGNAEQVGSAPEQREYRGIKNLIAYRTGLIGGMDSEKSARLMASTAILDAMASGAYGDSEAMKNTIGYIDGRLNGMPNDKGILFIQTGKEPKY